MFLVNIVNIVVVIVVILLVFAVVFLRFILPKLKAKKVGNKQHDVTCNKCK